MDREQVFRILLTSDATAEGERALNLLRRSGLSVQGRELQSPASLTDSLSAEPWQLIIAFADNARLTPLQVLAHLRETQQDIPCIVIDPDPGNTADYLEQGAAAVLISAALEQDDGRQRFVHRVRRELQQLEERRERRRLAVSLQEMETHYRELLDDTSDAVAWLHDGIHIYCNPAYREFLGYGPNGDLDHLPFLDLVSDQDVAPVRRFLGQDSASGERCAFHIRHQDGSLLPAELRSKDIIFQGERSLQIRLSPSTGSTAQRNRAAELAGRDLVTGLAARKRMLDMITQQISHAVYDNQPATLMVLELEDFDAVATVLGKADSNLVLSDFATILQKQSPTDAQCGRISTSGFAILFADTDRPQALLQLAQTFDRALQSLLPAKLHCSLSAGMTVINGEAVDAETLLVRAQHNRVLRLSRRTELGTLARQQHQLEKLKNALDNDDIVLVYQPVVSLREDQLERYEVRVRLRDGDQLIQPSEFLETASHHGLGGEIDRHVLRQAMRLLAQSQNPGLRLIINLTQNTITDATLLNWLADQLREHRLPGHQLIIQFSEIDALSAPEQLQQFCDRLRELDTGLAVAHFGCAMDPFSYLDRLPVRYAKLDRSLLLDIERDSGQRDKLQQLVSGLHGRGILVIAPMIEHMDILPLLWQSKINFVQGNCLREPSASLDFGFVQDQEITLQSPPAGNTA